MKTCPACGASEFLDIYDAKGVPVHSCLLLDNRAGAVDFPRGDIELRLCRTCGLIQNQAYDEAAMSYSSDYEDSQAHSPRFREFARGLIERLDATYHIAGKRAVEIGCGKGDFLVLMANQLGVTGLGIDPAYRPGPLAADDPAKVRFTTERFSAGYDLGGFDLVVCRHTLEHVPKPGEFVSAIRSAIGDEADTVVFFEVPDSSRILTDRAFWDVYYEHCSYFVEGSIIHLFQACGFDVLETWIGMDDQYLMLTAVPATRPHSADSSYVASLETNAIGFRADVASTVSKLRRDLDEASANDGTVVLWGASSKAVAYLHALDVHDEVAAVVDINPIKRGRYLAGSGLPIVTPDDLKEIDPSTVIVMNPAYRNEIQNDLGVRNIPARVVVL
jgi:Methyltransferase domain/C-methyltransferase C-terminal domain